MKRYWKLMVLAVVIVLTISTFYIKQNLASGNYPEMELQTKHGEEKFAANLILHTNIRTRCEDCQGNGGGQNVDVTTEGSTGEDDSFLSVIQGNPDPKIARLQENHRNFMRDKTETPAIFAEDKHEIAYADIASDGYNTPHQHFDLEIDWLDEEGDERSTFDVQLPDHEKYSDVFVHHVYITDDQVRVVTENQKDGMDADGGDWDWNIYTIDPESEKIVDEDTVLTEPEEINDDEWVDTYTVTNEEHQGKTDDLILVSEKGTDAETDESTKPSDVEMVHYNLQTGKKKELPLPDDLQNKKIEGYDGHLVYFSEVKDGKVMIFAYDIDDQSVINNQTIDLPDSMNIPDSEAVTTQIDEEKLYIVSDEQKEKQETSIIIVDMQSGENVYEGTIAVEDTIADYDIHINQLTFQDETEDQN